MSSNDQILLVSIHDVSPRFETAIDGLLDRLSAQLSGLHFAMLVVPDHWHDAPLAKAAAFGARLRGWAEAGVEMFLHGFYHRDEAMHKGVVHGFKARHMTAGEGEFLGLDRNEALRRMREGRAIVEDTIGMPVAGFIAPAWLYGAGALAALAEAGFAMAEDHMRVWRPSDGAMLAKGPVVTWASRSPARIASSLAFAALARPLLTPLSALRVAVHPGDVMVPALLGSIDRTIDAALRTRRSAHYSELLERPRKFF